MLRELCVLHATALLFNSPPISSVRRISYIISRLELRTISAMARSSAAVRIPEKVI